MRPTTKRDQNGQLVLVLTSPQPSGRGNQYQAEIYAHGDSFDLELFRLNDDQSRTRMNVSYWNDGLKNAIGKATKWIEYHNRSY